MAQAPQHIQGSKTVPDLERQTNIALGRINQQIIKGGSGGVSAAAIATLQAEINQLKLLSGGFPEMGGTGNPVPTPSTQTVQTDGVTIGGDGNATPLFSFVLSSFLVTTLAFAASPFSATLKEQQISLFLCSASAGADFVFDLPAATGSGNAGFIKKMDANAHNIAITPNGTDTIDGVNAAVNITLQYDVVRIVDGGSGAWVII